MGKWRHPRGGEVYDPFDLARSTKWIIRDLYDAKSLTGTDLDWLERAEIAGANRKSVLHAISIQRKLRHGHRRSGKKIFCKDCGRAAHGDSFAENLVCLLMMFLNLIKTML